MGMYDNIKFEYNCPNCGEKVSNFQSKDNGCSLRILNFRDVDNFYALCPKCKTWIEFNYKVELRATRNIEDYKMEFSPKKGQNLNNIRE